MAEAYLGERLIIRGNRIGCYVFLRRLLFPYDISIAHSRTLCNLYLEFFYETLAACSWSLASSNIYIASHRVHVM